MCAQVTPLKMALLLTGLNAILDPLFIFETINLPLHVLPCFSPGSVLSLPGLGLGAAGAALGTAVAS
jgi:Na+-driven multidrug efflux pump